VAKKSKAIIARLPLMQQKFVEEYIRHGNGAAAARAAGYAHDRARTTAAELVAKSNIQEAIEIEREYMRQSARTTREELLAEMLTIALGDPGDVLTIAKDDIKLKSGARMGRARRTIHSVSITETPGEFGVARSKKVSFHNKQAALNDVWEKLGYGTLDPVRDRGAFAGAIRAAMGRVKQRK
jgi:hypothetical protein